MPDSTVLYDKQQIMEMVIARFVTTGAQPLALYDIGVGPKSEANTLKTIFPEMEVFGCEPLIDLYPKEVASGFPGVLLPIGISSQEGVLKINYRDEGKLLDASALAEDLPNSKEVNVWTLDKFDRFANRPDRVMLWMDIEGMELDALLGAKELLGSGRVKWINLEERREGNVPEGWPHPKNIATLLEAYGYERALEYNVHLGHQDVIYTLGENSVSAK